jgi:hypothetical protein
MYLPEIRARLWCTIPGYVLVYSGPKFGTVAQDLGLMSPLGSFPAAPITMYQYIPVVLILGQNFLASPNLGPILFWIYKHVKFCTLYLELTIQYFKHSNLLATREDCGPHQLN